MSDETLTDLVAEAIAHNLSPVVRWLYAVFAAVIVGTAFIVGMVYDVKYGINDAKREAGAAQAAATTAIQASTDLRATVISHDRDLAVLKYQRGGQ